MSPRAVSKLSASFGFGAPPSEYLIENLGLDHAEYFQGVGVSNTGWEHVVVGIGDNAKDAYEDAVEGVAQLGYDVATLPTRPHGIRKRDCVPARAEGPWNWYVAIYVK